ncbi:MAG: CDP-glycerol glycerophosphotransferase family protein [Burkholderiales bacterium]|nr:CDP-glycerol glycerophosphotransferase family protein [Burkholderiales bacterium]
MTAGTGRSPAAPDPERVAGRDAPAASAPRSVEELAAACSRANLAQAESMARQFVASHPDDERAWHMLVTYVDHGGNHAEAGRLAARGRERLPSSRPLRFARARALAQCGRMEEAASLLGKPDRSHEESLLLAEVELARDPEAAGRIYESLAQDLPGNPVAAFGLHAAAVARRSPGRRPEVGFLLVADWHGWIQRSIAEALDARGIAFACTTSPWMLAAQRPKIVVLSSPTPPLMRELRLMLPGTRFVNTRHGVSVNGKNYGLYSAAACDHVCASSEWQAGEIRRLALLDEERVWATGYPQMDGMIRRLRKASADERGRPRRVLFAPTFNPELSAAFLAGEDPVAAIRGRDESIRVVLNAHPQLRFDAPRLLAAWRDLARTRPNVEYRDAGSCDTVALLADADVLVSDVSSMATQFLALDRPLVRLLDVARARASSAFDPGATEWQLGPVSTTVGRREDLAAAVKRALSGPEPPDVAARRARLREELFGTLADGRAGERIAQRLAQLRDETEPWRGTRP